MKKNFTLLLATTALILISAAAMAQGGLTPFAGSTHNYTITPESTSNTLTWSVVEGSGYTINSQTVVTTTSVANITWSAAGTYHLRFTEYDGTCTTIKEETIIVNNNTFDVSTGNPVATCNAADGQVNYSGTDAATTITFTISMDTGNSGFNPNWEITFDIAAGTGSPTINSVVSADGTLTDNGSGSYTLTGIASATGAGTAEIDVEVEGDINTLLTASLTITEAKELTYNTPDVDSDDWLAIQTINAIPATTNIITD